MDPSTGDWKLTPSSVNSARSNKETIWKPPLSVRRFLFQPMYLCNPPWRAKSGVVGRSPRWYVLARMISQPRSATCLLVSPFITP
jgi:hypothetical protein